MLAMGTNGPTDGAADEHVQKCVLQALEEIPDSLGEHIGSRSRQPDTLDAFRHQYFWAYSAVMGGLYLTGRWALRFANPVKLGRRRTTMNVLLGMSLYDGYTFFTFVDRVHRLDNSGDAQKQFCTRSLHLASSPRAQTFMNMEGMLLRQAYPEFFGALCGAQQRVERRLTREPRRDPWTGVDQYCLGFTKPEVRATIAYNLLAAQYEQGKSGFTSADDLVRMTAYLSLLTDIWSPKRTETIPVSAALMWMGGAACIFARRPWAVLLARTAAVLGFTVNLQWRIFMYDTLTQPFLFKDIDRVNDVFGTLLKTKYGYRDE